MVRSSSPSVPLEAKYRRSLILNAILAVAVVFLLVVAIAQGAGGAQTGAQPTPAASDGAKPSPTLERRDPADPMAVGAVDAPVVLIEWTDMRCPYCALFSKTTLPTLLKEYVDTGKVRIEVRDVAFFGDQSAQASVAARAAGRQGKFMEYLEAVYAAAPESGHPELPRDTLIGFAKTIGVPDIAAFTADLDDPALLSAVQQSTTEAQGLGVNSVPFFVAGGTAMSGAQPIENFREFLDNALAKAK